MLTHQIRELVQDSLEHTKQIAELLAANKAQATENAKLKEMAEARVVVAAHE